jgi:hypothetical protein
MAEIQRIRRAGSLARLALIVLGCALHAACGSGGAPAASADVVPEYDRDTGRLERITYDRDKDGQPDAWLFMDGTIAERAELDDNFDGAVDRWEHYDTAVAQSAGDGGIPRGTLVRAEQATRFDGVVSRWERYETGELASVEEDTTGDGRPDKWETWADGTLRTIALDTTGTGRPDRQIVYAADGSAPRLLVDTDGDGTFEPGAAP